MNRYIVLGIALALLFCGCTTEEPNESQKLYECDDGSLVKNLSNCPSTSTTTTTKELPSPMEVVTVAYEKRNNLTSYREVANNSFKISTKSVSKEKRYTIEFIEYEDKSRTRTIYENREERKYSLPSGTYRCVKQSGSWSCTQTSPSDKTAVMDKFKQLVKEGKIKFLGDVEKQKVAGRECYLVKRRANAEAIQEMQTFSSPELSHLNFNSNTKTTCYDIETGLKLLSKSKIEITNTRTGKSGTVTYYSKTKSVKTSLTFPEGTFDLPAELNS